MAGSRARRRGSPIRVPSVSGPSPSRRVPSPEGSVPRHPLHAPPARQTHTDPPDPDPEAEGDKHMADYANPAALVTPEWAKEHLDDPGVRFVEVDVDTAAF